MKGRSILFVNILMVGSCTRVGTNGKIGTSKSAGNVTADSWARARRTTDREANAASERENVSHTLSPLACLTSPTTHHSASVFSLSLRTLRVGETDAQPSGTFNRVYVLRPSQRHNKAVFTLFLYI